MEKKYWIGRKRAAMAMARAASNAEARLIHYDLAGRYSVRAAASHPFMIPRKGPATTGERAALKLPLPGLPRPGFIFRAPPRPGGSDEPQGSGR